MQDIREESWEIEDQTRTQGYVLRFEPLFYIPTFTKKDFHYVHTGPSTKGPSTKNYKYKLGVHNSNSLTHHTPLRKGVGASKEKKLQLGDHLDHKQ